VRRAQSRSHRTGVHHEKGTVVSLALADELFLMTHDLQTGKPRIAAPLLGTGLASALLAELMFAGSIEITRGLLALGEYGPPAERLSEALYEQARNQLAAEEVPVQVWLSSHRRPVEELVADRMIRAGDLRRDTSRRFGRTVVRYFPARPAEALLQAQRLPSYLRHRVEVTEPDVVVAVLARLVAPGGSTLELDETGRQYLDQLVPALHPSTRELLAITESSLAAAMRTLSH
jgi:Golgi phosphoprotein 3 (GPP34)